MRCATCALAIVLALGGVARAQLEQSATVEPLEPDRPILRRWRIPIVIAETAATLIPPTIYYWNTTSQQREDWEMNWTWSDWKLKLTSLDALSVDTGYWEANAIRHPIGGALD